MYVLHAKPTVEKDLRSINPKDLPGSQCEDQIPYGPTKESHTQKLKGAEGYRLRSGKYRILYEIDDKSRTITIRWVLHRKEA